MAVMLEHGPIRIKSDLSVELNPNTWNHYANIIYVDQPVNVGFSQFDGEQDGSVYTDDNVAEENLDFIKQFMDLHPEFKDNEFYVAAES